MTELSTEARTILEAGRAGLSPSAVTKASVLSAVEGNIAGAASAPSLGASATAGSGVASLKIVLALVLAVGVGGGIWLARTTSVSSNETNSESEAISANTIPSEETRDRAVIVSDKNEKSESEIAIPTAKDESTITKSHTAEPPLSAELKPIGKGPKQTVAKIDQRQKSPPNRSAQVNRKTKTTAAPILSTLADEQKLIAAAQVAIRKADYSKAIGLLKNHESQFPKGILAPERNAASAIAGCLSEQSGSKAAGRRFLTNHAHSPLASRVRSSCKLP